MAMQVSVAARNALLEDVATSLVTPTLRVMRILNASQSSPDTQTGTVLAEITLPSSPFAAASAGSMSLTNTWQDLSINTTGTAVAFRLVGANSPGYNVSGTVGVAGSGADMIVDTVSFIAGQSFVVTSLTMTCD